MQTEYSKRARATTVKAFVRFLQAENADLEYVKGCIQRDDSGQRFVSVMDKLGMHLAFPEGRAGKPLARHSSMHYYRKAFRGECGAHSKVANAVLKQVRALHRSGELNGKIQRYFSLL